MFDISAIIIDHPTYSAPRHHNHGGNNPMFAGREKILNDGFFTNIDNSRAYIVSKMDLDEWEKMHGRIPNGALVILRTGWSQYFEQPDNFFGNFADDDKQVFPGNFWAQFFMFLFSRDVIIMKLNKIPNSFLYPLKFMY